MILYGTGSGSITSSAYNILGTIVTICLWNRAAGATAVSVGIVVGTTNTFLFSANLAASGAANSSVYQKANIVVKAGWKIIISASGATDYYILMQ